MEQAEAGCTADDEVRSRQRERDREWRARQDVELTARMAEEITRLMSGVERHVARARVRGEVDTVLDRWR